MRDASSSFMAMGLGVVVALFLAPVEAMALAYAWNTLVVPAWPGAGEIVWTQALAAPLIAFALSASSATRDGDTNQSSWERIGASALYALVRAAMVIALAWVYAAVWL